MTDTVLTKIRKLLELAKSTNEHEAATAAARAADLMLRHQIEEADLQVATEEKPDPIVDEAIDQFGKRVAWKSYLIWGLAESFGCQPYYVTGGVSREYVVGPASVMATIRYLYTYLSKEVIRLADEGYRIECDERHKSGVYDLPAARSWKASFRAGAAQTIRTRLREQRAVTFRVAREEGKTTALAVIDRQTEAVEKTMRARHPSLYKRDGKARSGSGFSGGRSSRSGYESGVSAGRQVSLPGTSRQLGSGAKQLKGGSR